ncbi:MAG: hypothetical protein K2Q22_11005, partial [Cytophagales bacterium]|nr:hypothetical protein [Cytophagales bacterium]
FLTYPKVEGVVGQTELISLGGISFYEFSPSLELRTVVGGLVRPDVPLYPGYKAYQLPNRWMGSEGLDRTMAQWGKVLSWAPDLLPLYSGGDVYSVKESEGEVYNNEVSNTLGQLSAIGTEGRRWTVGRGYYKNGYDGEHNLPVVTTEWEWTRKLTFEPSTLGKIQPVFQVGDPKVKQVLFGWDVALSDNKDMGKMFRFAEFRLWSEGMKSWPVLSLTFDYARSVKYAGVAPEGKGYCSIWGTRPFLAAKFCDPSKVGHDFVWSDTNNALVTKTHVDLPIKDRNAGVVYTFGWNDRLNFVFAGTERLSPVYGLVWVDRQGGSGGVAITNDTLKKYLVPSAVPHWADIRTNSYTIESHRVLEDGSLWFTLAGKANSWETVVLPDGNTEQRPVSYYVGALFLHMDRNGRMLGVYYVPKSDKKVGFSYSHVIQILSLKDGVMKAVILEPALKKS